MTGGRRNLLLGLAALAVVVVIVVVVAAVHSGSKGSSSASPTTVGTAASGPRAGADGSTTTGAGPAPTTSTSASGRSGAATTSTTQAIPLQVKVSSTSGLHDGSVVTVAVTADKGSQYYGLDARLCAGTAHIENFYDYTPDPAGNCILKPLSADSDAYLEQATAPPHTSGTLSFRVGVGTDTFTTENATKASITCGPGHPCQLVVRLQYPDNFGFRSFPIIYSG
jgi:hypothetical protein